MEPSDAIIKLQLTNTDGEDQTIHVHRGVLCKSSEFFQKALKPEWAQLREHADTIELPDDPPQTVRDYVRWLYCGTVPISLAIFDQDKGLPEDFSFKAEEVFNMIAKAYVYGEKILDVVYKNALMSIMLEAAKSTKHKPGPSTVSIVYTGTPSRSPLRRFIADTVAHCGGEGYFDHLGEYPKAALLDALRTTVKLRDRPLKHEARIDSYLEQENEGDDKDKKKRKRGEDE